MFKLKHKHSLSYFYLGDGGGGVTSVDFDQVLESDKGHNSADFTECGPQTGLMNMKLNFGKIHTFLA